MVAAAAERLARLVIHLHRDVAMNESRGLGDPRETGEDGRHQRLVAIEPEAKFGAPDEGDVGTRDDQVDAVVTPHDVERCSDGCRHSD